jgi:D-glycero-D-manno-heptose 1,7-bisphosphate phosphatase
VSAQFSNISYVLLDRDGVINRKPREGEYVGYWCEFQLLPGAESAINALNRSGRRVLVVTNQRGIALGLYSCADVDDTHARLRNHLAGYGAHIDGIYICPHDKDQCTCRKPRTGLFEQVLRDFPELVAHEGIVIGDSLSDIEFARNLGLPSIFIQGEPDTQSPRVEQASSLGDAVAGSLLEAVEKYL